MQLSPWNKLIKQSKQFLAQFQHNMYSHSRALVLDISTVRKFPCTDSFHVSSNSSWKNHTQKIVINSFKLPVHSFNCLSWRYNNKNTTSWKSYARISDKFTLSWHWIWDRVITFKPFYQQLNKNSNLLFTSTISFWTFWILFMSLHSFVKNPVLSQRNMAYSSRAELVMEDW